MVKLTNANILSAFRKQVGITKKDESAFLEAFQSVFEEALLRDKILKINGLGTFKLLPVGARKSVDVNTGEKIEIAEHYKITFTPDAQLRDKVNQPLAHLETVEMPCNDSELVAIEEDINLSTKHLSVENISSTSDIDTISDQDDSPLQKLVEQAVELKELLSDIQSIGVVSTEENITANSSVESQIQEPKIEINQVEPKSESVEESIAPKAEPITMESTNQKNKKDSISDEDIISAINDENDFSNKRSTWVWILIAIILFVVIIALLIYKNRDFFASNEKSNQPTEMLTETIDTIQVDTIDAEQQLVADVLGQELIANSDTTNMFEAEPLSDTTSIYCDKFSDIFNYKREYVEFIDTITLNGGKRLTLISLEYYGHKDFWVYIYEANKDAIQHPNSVKVGVKLRIPKILPELIDASNSEAIEYARYLHDIYIKK